MSKSAAIRELGRLGGLSVSEIAKRVGVSYQFAYNVLRDAHILDAATPGDPNQSRLQPTEKPPLAVEMLLDAQFTRVGCWSVRNDRIALEKQPPSEPGVYVFVWKGVAQYVGVATISLAKRMYQYANPGIGQRTNVRVNGLLHEGLTTGCVFEVFVACPPDLEWNGLPVSGAAGLELGLIQTFDLPWNKRGV